MLVRALQTAAEFERYIDFGRAVYRGHPQWVEPDPHDMELMLGGLKEAGPHWHAQPFWIETDGDVLATLTAVVDDLYNRHWGERTGHLLYFEAWPDSDEAVGRLFEAAVEWLRGQTCSRARASFLYGWQLPWTIDAYDAVPTLFHTYNPAYYHRYVKNAGFETERGMVEYRVRFTPALAAGYREMVARAAAGGVRLRRWDWSRLEAEVSTWTPLLNETFAGHWGAPPLTVAQTQGFLGGMKDVMVPDFLRFAELGGETVGFVVSFPDLNQARHAMRGKRIEEHRSEFEARLAGIDHGVLQIIGVQERARGRSVNLALAAQSYLAMIERGYRTGSFTVVLDDNWPSRRTAERLGARVARNFAIYQKALIR